MASGEWRDFWKCEVSSKLRFMYLNLVFSFLLIGSTLVAQVPGRIPYQSIARNTQGQVVTYGVLNAKFILVDSSNTSLVIWQEQQTLITDSTGLFKVELGTFNSISSIDWTIGSKFLHLEIDFGDGFIDVGRKKLVCQAHGSKQDYNSSEKENIENARKDSSVTEIGKESLYNPSLEDSITIFIDESEHWCGEPKVHNSKYLYGRMADQDGNVYKTITIGKQVWMAENLNTSIYRDGSSIPTNLDNESWNKTEFGAWSYYNNDPRYHCPNGKLYNWYACIDERQLCPVDWHVPTDSDWLVLSEYLGGAGVAGGRMKSAGFMDDLSGHWLAMNDAGTDESGFSATPSGCRTSYGEFIRFGYYGYWWCSSLMDRGIGWNRSIAFKAGTDFRDYSNVHFGYSVRCVKD